MKRRHLCSTVNVFAAGLLALAFTPRHALADGTARSEMSFTARTLKETNVEGPDVERTYFTAAGKRIVFGTPEKCRLSQDGSGLVLNLAETQLDGEIHVSNSAFTPDFDLAENALKYRDAATKSMPRGATQVEVQQPVMNPYPYNGWKSLGFTWTYAYSGRPMVRTVSYINLEVGVQIIVTTLALKSDAAKVDKLAKEFMSSWWVMGDR